VTDIFREVEEDVRRERFEKIWKQYGDYIIAGAAAIVIGVAGYKLWTRYEDQQRFNASKTFVAAQEAADSGNTPAAQAMFAKLAQSAPGGYKTVAKLAEANTLLVSGKRNDAITIYKSIADNDSSPLGDAARMRAAWAEVDSVPRAELEQFLAPLTAQTSEWRFMAREVLAYADYRAGAAQQARKEFQALADDKGSSQSLRDRAHAMAIFISTGGERTYGAVPLPKPAPAPTPLQPSEGPPTP
jgi:hypothetical protein